jgi:hypothetical protein
VRAHRACRCAGGGERTARNCESMLLSVKEHIAKGAEEMARVGRLASSRVSRYCMYTEYASPLGYPCSKGEGRGGRRQDALVALKGDAIR